MTDLCLCAGAPQANGLASGHLINMAEQNSTRGHVFILKHQPHLCYANLLEKKPKQTYVCLSPCCRMADCWDNLSQNEASYQHELESLPSALAVLTDGSTQGAGQR